MSNRHRRRRPNQPSIVPPSRDERAGQHRKVRHKVHTDLHMLALDPDAADDVALHRPRHTRIDVDPSELDGPSKPSTSRFRVWKTKAWKRRKLERQRRNEQLRGPLDEPGALGA